MMLDWIRIEVASDFANISYSIRTVVTMAIELICYRFY